MPLGKRQGWTIVASAFAFGLLLSVLALMPGSLISGAHAFGLKKSPDSASAPRAQSSASVSETVWVQKPDGGQQCAPDTALSLDAGAADLAKARIQILHSRKGSDGKMRTQVCGAPTGSQNAYEIRRGDLARAKSLGFEEVVIAP